MSLKVLIILLSLAHQSLISSSINPQRLKSRSLHYRQSPSISEELENYRSYGQRLPVADQINSEELRPSILPSNPRGINSYEDASDNFFQPNRDNGFRRAENRVSVGGLNVNEQDGRITFVNRDSLGKSPILIVEAKEIDNSDEDIKGGRAHHGGAANGKRPSFFQHRQSNGRIDDRGLTIRAKTPILDLDFQTPFLDVDSREYDDKSNGNFQRGIKDSFGQVNKHLSSINNTSIFFKHSKENKGQHDFNDDYYYDDGDDPTILPSFVSNANNFPRPKDVLDHAHTHVHLNSFEQKDVEKPYIIGNTEHSQFNDQRLHHESDLVKFSVSIDNPSSENLSDGRLHFPLSNSQFPVPAGIDILPLEDHSSREHESSLEFQSQKQFGFNTQRKKPVNDHHGSHEANYEFGYEVTSDGVVHGHQESRKGKKVTGHYHVDLPNGLRQIVSYYADETGYHPTITYEKINNIDPRSLTVGEKPRLFLTESQESGENHERIQRRLIAPVTRNENIPTVRRRRPSVLPSSRKLRENNGNSQTSDRTRSNVSERGSLNSRPGRKLMFPGFRDLEGGTRKEKRFIHESLLKSFQNSLPNLMKSDKKSTFELQASNDSVSAETSSYSHYNTNMNSNDSSSAEKSSYVDYKADKNASKGNKTSGDESVKVSYRAPDIAIPPEYIKKFTKPENNESIVMLEQKDLT